MKTDSIHSDEEKLAARYEELIKPIFEANTAHMHHLVENEDIQTIIQQARVHLGIPKNGRKPNNPKTFNNELNKLVEKHRVRLPILLYTTTLDERGILGEYVDKIMTEFDVYENFKDCFEIYVIHNVILAPVHNVGLNNKIYGDGRSHLPEIHFYRAPYVNDWEIAKLLLERHIRALPDKFKKSYRGKKNLKEHQKIVQEASNRKRISAMESISITNAEIADEIYGDVKKEETIKKVLTRNRKRVKEIASKRTLHK